jgi:hypothetical protein
MPACAVCGFGLQPDAVKCPFCGQAVGATGSSPSTAGAAAPTAPTAPSPASSPSTGSPAPASPGPTPASPTLPPSPAAAPRAPVAPIIVPAAQAPPYAAPLPTQAAPAPVAPPVAPKDRSGLIALLIALAALVLAVGVIVVLVRRDREAAVPATTTSVASPGTTTDTSRGDDTAGPDADPDADRPGPEVGARWTAAFGIYLCDSFIADPVDRNGGEQGIHMRGDGLVEVDPADDSVAGDNATLGVLADEVGLAIDRTGVTLPSKTVIRNGDDCRGTPGEWKVVRWTLGSSTPYPTTFRVGLDRVRFTRDHQVLVLAFVPRGDGVPQPPSAQQLLQNVGTVKPGFK